MPMFDREETDKVAASNGDSAFDLDFNFYKLVVECAAESASPAAQRNAEGDRFDVKLRFCDSLRSLLRGFFLGLLVGARSSEDTNHRVISLVTRIFVDSILTL